MKKWLCMLLAGALVFSLTACHRNQNPDTLPTESTGAKLADSTGTVQTGSTETAQNENTGETTPATQESTTGETTPATQGTAGGDFIPVIQGPHSSSSNPELAETFIAILKNEEPFYHSCYRHYPSEMGKIFLSDLLSEHEANIWKYSYVDMDSDNNEELVIALGNPFDTLILRKEGPSVFCLTVGHREMYQINLDGSFLWNSNAGMTNGCSRFSFSGCQYEAAELWRVENSESGPTKFYIKGEPVSSEDEFYIKVKEWPSNAITWINWEDSQ